MQSPSSAEKRNDLDFEKVLAQQRTAIGERDRFHMALQAAGSPDRFPSRKRKRQKQRRKTVTPDREIDNSSQPSLKKSKKEENRGGDPGRDSSARGRTGKK